MRSTLITNARMLKSDQSSATAQIRIADGKIVDMQPHLSVTPEDRCIDAGGMLVTPGLIDLHTHGIESFLYERSGDDLARGCDCLARFGVTSVLPTLYKVLKPSDLAHLGDLASAARGVRSARVPGFHLEGPFLALAGAGAETRDGDVGFLKDLLAACNSLARVMSVSPETRNIIPVIEYLVGAGVVPFITHTQASAEQTRQAIDAGARHATHFYDVFPIPPEVEPGVRQVGAVECILADDRCSVDFICDGVHAPPVAIQCAIAARGWNNIVCITDSNIGAGLPAGEFEHPWGYRIRTSPNDGARIADPAHADFNGLAGSALTLNRGVANMLRWFPQFPASVWNTATENPARIARLERVGTLAPGMLADLVVWNDDLSSRLTMLGGDIVFDSTLKR